jgi:hypothetical protein
MLREELDRLPTAPRDLRRFGLLVGGVFLALAAWALYRNRTFWPWFAAPGVPLALLGLLRPRSLKHAYLAWMSLALVLGLLVSTLLLALLFYLVVTPVGLLARLCGKDFLQRRISRGAASYWIRRDPSVVRTPDDYERQF